MAENSKTREELFKEVEPLLKPLCSYIDECTYDILNDTLVIGDPELNLCIGCVWVFQNVDGAWVLKQTIKRPYPNPEDDNFGQQINLSASDGKLTIRSWYDKFDYYPNELGEYVFRENDRHAAHDA